VFELKRTALTVRTRLIFFRFGESFR